MLLDIARSVFYFGHRLFTHFEPPPKSDFVTTSKTLETVAEHPDGSAGGWPFGDVSGYEHRYRMVFEESRDAICITSRDGRIIDCNNAAVDLFGYAKDELLRMNASILYADPGDRERFLEEIDNWGSVKDFELRMRTRSGALIDCLSTSSAQRQEDGRVLGYYCIIRDITERNRSQEALRKAYDKAEQHVHCLLYTSPSPRD